MKKIYYSILTLALIALVNLNLQAQEGGLSVGAQVVDAGISAELGLNESMALTGLTSFVVGDVDNLFRLQFNLIFKNSDPQFDLESGRLAPYYGVGLNMTFREVGDPVLGLRFPLGIQYSLEDQPISVYTDIAPTLDFSPDTIFYLSGSLGFRYKL